MVRGLGALMAMDRDTISQRMRTTIPRCIAQFVTAPAERPEPWKGNDIAVWRLACKCGGQYGSFLGYPLSRYNTQYSGSAFVGPLGFECAKCGRVTEIGHESAWLPCGSMRVVQPYLWGGIARTICLSVVRR
jgi:hypothetical protein